MNEPDPIQPVLLRREFSSSTVIVIGILCATAMSGIGLMIGAWTGTGDRVATSFAFFWILPALALPVFLLKLLWQGMPTLVFWLFFLGQGGSLALSNWNECVHGKCTTSNPFLVALSGFAYPPIWGWVVLALISIALGTVRKSASRSVSSS